MRCLACKAEFRPRRSTARYCGDRCRKRASRPNSVPQPQKRPPRAFLSVTGHPRTQEAANPLPAPDVTLIPQQIRESKPLPDGIVPDAKWPGMYRLRLPDGSLSAMVNLTRAKDALAHVRQDEPRETQRAAGQKRTPRGYFPLTKGRAGLQEPSPCTYAPPPGFLFFWIFSSRPRGAVWPP
jgi:hypothetical protein